jgi:hypothetical protein
MRAFMRRLLPRLTVLVFAGALALPGPASAQSTATCARAWVGHEDDFERALAEGAVTGLEKVDIGVTRPKRGSLDPPTPVARFTWKPLKPGYHRGYMESYKAEIAAYRLDRLLGLQMVPPVIERTLDGVTGAAVYWIENMKPWNDKKPPRGPEPEWSHQLARMKMFDLLVANIDRNKGNLGYDDDWHLLLIDHSRAFTGKKDLKGMAALVNVDRTLWAKMSALTLDSLRMTLAGLVSDDDLEALLTRRNKMAETIDRLVRKRGPSVFFN